VLLFFFPPPSGGGELAVGFLAVTELPSIAPGISLLATAGLAYLGPTSTPQGTVGLSFSFL
jgi:hypothetical protein